MEVETSLAWNEKLAVNFKHFSGAVDFKRALAHWGQTQLN